MRFAGLDAGSGRGFKGVAGTGRSGQVEPFLLEHDAFGAGDGLVRLDGHDGGLQALFPAGGRGQLEAPDVLGEGGAVVAERVLEVGRLAEHLVDVGEEVLQREGQRGVGEWRVFVALIRLM